MSFVAYRMNGTLLNDYARALEQDGFALAPDFLGETGTIELAAAMDRLAARRGAEGRAGVRNILPETEAVAAWVCSAPVRELLGTIFSRSAFVTRSILFDKSPAANWAVAWHQDLTIAVAERKEAPGYGGWSIKDGLAHVQAPRETLERMTTLRLHLDNCPADNGALRVLPGAHRLGKLEARRLGKLAGEIRPAFCATRRGGLLLMKPLLPHSSEAAKSPGRRRVLHLEFADFELPGGLAWASRFGHLSA
jgi:ectoine hydroxylase-related dioxygenase (phytanoyl-CoA dioxygenase family)